MSFLQSIKSGLKAPFLMPLRWAVWRQRLIFEIRQRYYGDLDLSVPLGNGLRCPVLHPEHWCSFSEIFLDHEYSAALPEMPLPARWLDLGCHAGFFSLWVVWQRMRGGLKRDDLRALLVDGDRRVGAAVERLIEVNHLKGQFTFQHGAIASQAGELVFAERGYMASAAAVPGESDGTVCRVPVVDAEALLRLMPPPCDLVKIDVEGSEYDFLNTYAPVLRHARHLVMEWHSWHRGGGGPGQLMALAESRGFTFSKDIVPPKIVTINGKAAECGVWLFKRRAGSDARAGETR